MRTLAFAAIIVVLLSAPSNIFCSIIEIATNPNVSFRSDIQRIKLDTTARKIKIELKPVRRCDKPSFVVRMSGPAVYMLKLVEHNFIASKFKLRREKQQSSGLFEPRKNIMVYEYPPILESGSYFVEILMIYCATVDLNNLEHLCPEIPEDAIINNPTQRFALIKDHAAEKYPHWTLESSNQLAQYLPTRFQHKGCGPNNDWCPPSAKEVEQHIKYSWSNAPDWRPALKEIIERHQKKHASSSSSAASSSLSSSSAVAVASLSLCLIGDSHTHYIQNDLKTAMQQSGLHLRFIHQRVNYPKDFNATQVFSSHQCSYALLWFGQWAFSFISEPSYTMNQWRVELEAVAADIRSYHAAAAHARNSLTQGVPAPKVYILSTNYNALGGYQTMCPSFDHRQVPILDMQNEVTKDVCEKAGLTPSPAPALSLSTSGSGAAAEEPLLTYLDLTHIMGPMWDSAEDYCHPIGKVFQAQAEWIYHVLFNGPLRNGSQEELYFGVPMYFTEGAVVRAHNAQTVYLVKEGILRPFQSGKQFMAMGFTFDDVQAVSPSIIEQYPIGPSPKEIVV